MANKLEWAWTLATVALISGVAVYSTVLLVQLDQLPAHPSEYVDVIAHQWFWEFCYPANGTCFNTSYDPATNSATGGALWAAPGTTIQINVTSVDVAHSFNIPNLGVRIDAIPGRTNDFGFNVPMAPAGTQ